MTRDPRIPFLQSASTWLLERYARQLPFENRLVLAASLIRPDPPKTADDAAWPPEREYEADAEPDWDAVWRLLLAGAGVVDALADAPEWHTADVRFGQLVTDMRTLLDKVEGAYKTTCIAARMDVNASAGIHLGHLQDRVARFQAARVDELLNARAPQLADGAPVWKIDYGHHGGFLARADQPDPDLAAPNAFWGFASTPAGARDVVQQWFTGGTIPQVLFDLPSVATRAQLVTFTVEADMSVEGHADLELALRTTGRCYDETRAAAARTRSDLQHREPRGYLEERAAELNSTDPQLTGDIALAQVGADWIDLHDATVHGACWVPTDLVVATNNSQWGEFGDHRPEVLNDIAESLASDVELDQFLQLFFDLTPIDLRQIPGWAGPVYRIGVNGNHRVHAARLLGLPWVQAIVNARAVPAKWDLFGLLRADSDPAADYEQRVAMLRGMIHRGVIDAEIQVRRPESPLHSTTLTCLRLPAPWLLQHPAQVARVNRAYEARYPGALQQIGIPPDVGTDPHMWVAWLTG